MAQGLGFIEFSTGDVLSAAAANGYLASQTVMVFADAAARTTAITTPYEGMMSYLKDTNSVEYYSGSAWVAVSGGSSGGMTLLSTTTLSGASTTISLSGTYKNLQVVIGGVTFASGSNVLRIAPNGVTNLTDMAFTRTVGTSASNVGSNNDYIQTFSGYLLGDANNSVVLNLFNYQSTTRYKSFQFFGGFKQANPDNFAFNAGGVYKSNSAISSLVISGDLANLSGGTVLVYGVN